MAPVTFTVIVPTTGRPTLARTLASISTEMGVGDELICLVNDDGHYGARSIDSAQQRAKGSHLLYCDDDDIFVPGSFDRLRSWAESHPSSVGIFRRAFLGGAQWDKPVLVHGNIQRMCLCIPNVPGKLPVWDETPFESNIVEQAVELQGCPYEFVDEIVGLVRPHTRTPWRRFRFWLRPRSRLRALGRGPARHGAA